MCANPDIEVGRKIAGGAVWRRKQTLPGIIIFRVLQSVFMGSVIMDERKKRRMGIYSFLPLAAIIVATAVHLLLFRDEIRARDMEDHIALATKTARHFTMLAVLYGTAALVSLGVLLYFIAHLLRQKCVARGEKLFWAVMLTMFLPLSFPLFWYTKIRREPRRPDMYPQV